MTVRLTGFELTFRSLLSIAIEGERVEFADEAIDRMIRARQIAERLAGQGTHVYGLTTGVGARKVWQVGEGSVAAFNRGVIETHRVGQGPEARPELVRATLARLANGFAKGTVAIRPELAQRLLDVLNEKRTLKVRMLGSNGCGDLAPLADLAHEVVGDFPLQQGEGLALINSNAFTTASAALALDSCERLLRSLLTVAACELDAFGANLHVILHELIADIRPSPNLASSMRSLRAALSGSYLWERTAARNLQDPLCFRSLPQTHGAALDAVDFSMRQLDIELNASQENPVVDQRRQTITSICSFDIVPLAAALDYLRIALASVLTAACERTLKLLQGRFSGLPQGLSAVEAQAQSGLDVFGQSAQAFVAEARLLAQPVSFEVASTTQADGIEDRINMGPLSARRLDQMVELGERLMAIQLVIVAQALDLRRRGTQLAFGSETLRTLSLVRERVPFMAAIDSFPVDLAPLVALARSGRLSGQDRQVGQG